MLTVLVLEDDMLLLKAIEDKLTRRRFNVLSARTFEQAMTQMQDDSAKIDLVWLDHYLLGQKTGLDFLTAIRLMERWRVLPVFIVSNSASPEMIRAYQAFDDVKYYTKSDFKLEDIVSDIEEFFKTRQHD